MAKPPTPNSKKSKADAPGADQSADLNAAWEEFLRQKGMSKGKDNLVGAGSRGHRENDTRGKTTDGNGRDNLVGAGAESTGQGTLGGKAGKGNGNVMKRPGANVDDEAGDDKALDGANSHGSEAIVAVVPPVELKRNVMKSRRFQSYLESGNLPEYLKAEADKLNSQKGKPGFPYRAEMTKLIEGCMTQDATGKYVVDEQTHYCKTLRLNSRETFVKENFEIMIWEEAAVKCGGDAALLSALGRGKCHKKNKGDPKSDIIFPKHSFGRNISWTQSELFGNDMAIDQTAHAQICEDFDNLASGALNDLQSFIDDGDKSLPEVMNGLPAIANGPSTAGGGACPVWEDNLFCEDVDRMQKARSDLWGGLCKLQKTDTLIDKLLQKAQEVDSRRYPRLQKAINECLGTQEEVTELVSEANKIFKFRKNKEGAKATIQDHIDITEKLKTATDALLGDSVSVRAHMPKEGKGEKEKRYQQF